MIGWESAEAQAARDRAADAAYVTGHHRRRVVHRAMVGTVAVLVLGLVLMMISISKPASSLATVGDVATGLGILGVVGTLLLLRRWRTTNHAPEVNAEGQDDGGPGWVVPRQVGLPFGRWSKVPVRAPDEQPDPAP